MANKQSDSAVLIQLVAFFLIFIGSVWTIIVMIGAL